MVQKTKNINRRASFVLGGIVFFGVCILLWATDFDRTGNGITDTWKDAHGFSTNALVSPSGLIGWWQCDVNNSTNLYDRSANVLDGTYINLPISHDVLGLFSNALEMTTNSLVNFNTNSVLNLTNGFSMVLWLKETNDTTHTTSLVEWTGDHTNSWAICIATNGVAQFRFYGPFNTQTLTGSSSVQNGQWHQIIGTYKRSSSNAVLWVDGVAEQTSTITVTNFDTLGIKTFNLGTSNLTKPNPSSFDLDELRLYNRALDTNEVISVPMTYSDNDRDGLNNLQEFLGGNDPNVVDYPLTLSVSGVGSITGATSGNYYQSNSVITLTGVPGGSAYVFSSWSGDITGTSNPSSVTMTGSKSVTATFVSDTIPPNIYITSPTNGLNSASGLYTTNLVVTSGTITDSGDGGWTGGSTQAYLPAAAIDGVLTWSGPSTLTDGFNHHCLLTPTAGWLKYDFGSGSSKKIAKYTLSSSIGISGRPPKNWTFEGSNDGSNWTTLDTRNNQTSWTRGAYNSYTFNNSTAYRYYRINISANNGDADYTDIDEWQMMEALMPMYSTNSGAILLSGTASDNGVFTVSWTNMTSGASGSATGTTNWTASSVSLLGGTNQVAVVATDGAGNQASDRLDLYTSSAAIIGVTPSGDTVFTNTMIGGSQSQTFTVTNTGTATLVGSASVDGSAFLFTTSTNYSVSASGSTFVIVQYAPTTDGPFTNIVTFTGGGGVTRKVIGSTFSDANANSIPDSWEYQYFGTNYLLGGVYGASGDPDNDGYSNLNEYQKGGNPNSVDYLLTVNVVGDGSVSGGVNGHLYSSNAVLTLDISTNAGSVFGGWSGDLGGAAHPTNLTMNASKSVTALFLDSQVPVINILSPTNGLNSASGLYTTNLVVTSGTITDSGDGGWTGGSTQAYLPAAAIDGVLTWSGPSTLTDGFNHHCLLTPTVGWLKYDFGSGSSKKIAKYTLSSSIGISGRPPKNWTFEGSNDGSNWTTLDTRTNQTSWTRGSYNSYTFNNSTAYRYYRINISANNGDADYTDIDEWQMMEVQMPMYSTNGGLIALAGTASDNGTFTVAWTNITTGASGTATGTTNWTASALSLASGTNQFAVIATDTSGNQGTDRLNIFTSTAATIGVTPGGDTVFTNTMIGGSQSQTFTITNTGTATLVGSVSVDGSAFLFTTSTNYTISTNGSSSITLQYAPITNGPFTNIVTFLGGGGATRRAIGSTITDANANSIPDSWEYQYFGTNYLSGGAYGPSGDPDNDGYSNLVEYQKDGNPNSISFPLTLNVIGGGTVSGGMDNQLYTTNTVLTLVASTNAGNIFVGWSGDLSGSSNSTNLTINGSKRVVATFSDILGPTITITGPTNGINSVTNSLTPLLKGPIASSTYSGYTMGGAFDGVADQTTDPYNAWAADLNGGLPQWIGCDFTNAPPVVNKYSIYSRLLGYYPSAWIFQASQDNTTWTNLHSMAVSSNSWSTNVFNIFSFTNSTAYRSYRLYITNCPSLVACRVHEFQLWDNTHQVAPAVASQTTSSYSPLGAFDGFVDNPSASTKWSMDTAKGFPQWIRYDMGASNSHIVQQYRLYSGGNSPTNWEFQASVNGMVWKTLDKRTVTPGSWVTTSYNVYSVTNDDYYRAYRLWFPNGNGSANISLDEIQFWEKKQPAYATTNIVISLTGTASDNNSYALGWSNITSEVSGSMSTSNNWTASNIPLLMGSNCIQVSAIDIQGNIGVDRIWVVSSATDTDGDGMPNLWEIAHGLNPASSTDASQDPDSDGLTNLQEYQLGTDPQVADTNGDGISDGDSYNLGISPSDNDIDHDGISNADEIAQGTNPFNRDTDGDGVPDGLDTFPLDPTRWTSPSSNSKDKVGPTINLLEPTPLP